jgi:hypothetical protein
MFKMRNGRPSPALVVSIAALVMAMAGSAVALPGKKSVEADDLAKGAVTKKAIAKGAVTKKAIKAKAVTAKAIKDGSVDEAKLKDGSVGDAKLKDGAVGTGKLADNAVTDAKLDGVAPAAYAYINDDHAIDPTNSIGVDGATATLDGSFICFSGLSFTPKNVQVTTARLGGTGQTVFPNAFAPGVDNNFCDGAEQASVQFFDDTGALDNDPPPFYVTFFK